MARPTLLVIGGMLATIRKAATLGLRVVYVQQKHLYNAEHGQYVDTAILTDFTNWDTLRPLVEAAHESFEIGGVVTLTERGLDVAGRVVDLLGLPGNGHAVHDRLRDKLAMRRRLRDLGHDTVAFAEVTDEESLEKAATEVGYPFILKPADGVASLGVFRVDRPADLADAWRHVQRIRASDFPMFPATRFIGEECLSGREFSVESFTFDGRHVVLAITEKLTLDNYIEVGHGIPARISGEDGQHIAEAVRAFLDAVEVQQGPTHTELRLTPAGPRIIESHTRVGGDHIIELVEAAYGVDEETYAVAWPFGLVPALVDSPPLRTAVATKFVVAGEGTVASIAGVDEIRAQDDVVLFELNVDVGSTVGPLRWSWDRLGQVVATAPTTDAAFARCDELLGRLELVIH